MTPAAEGHEIHFEFRAPADPGDAQFVFRATIYAETEREAFDQGAVVGRLVWKVSEGFNHGQITMVPMVAPPELPAAAEGVSS